jgi:hypothetical protein
MSLDLGATVGQMQAAMDEVSSAALLRSKRFADRIRRALAITPGEAIQRTRGSASLQFVVAQTGDEGLLDSIPPPSMPTEWAAVSVDGSHIDVDRHLPVSCYLINLGGCELVYGDKPTCRLFSEPTLAVRDDDLYVAASESNGLDTAISGALLGALRTAREVERLADAVEEAGGSVPLLAVLDGTLAFRDVQSGNYPSSVVRKLIGDRLELALERIRQLSHRTSNVVLASYTSRPGTNEVAGALRVCLCRRDLTECALRCNLRRSDLEVCDGAAGFNDRDLFENVLEPGHRSPLYVSGRRAPPSSLGHPWVHFYYVNGGEEIARVEVPEWVADHPRLLGLSHAFVVRQCRLGQGYPVVISEAHQQAVVTGRDRREFRNAMLNELEKHGLPASESSKSLSKRRPWV